MECVLLWLLFTSVLSTHKHRIQPLLYPRLHRVVARRQNRGNKQSSSPLNGQVVIRKWRRTAYFRFLMINYESIFIASIALHFITGRLTSSSLMEGNDDSDLEEAVTKIFRAYDVDKSGLLEADEVITLINDTFFHMG